MMMTRNHAKFALDHLVTLLAPIAIAVAAASSTLSPGSEEEFSAAAGLAVAGTVYQHAPPGGWGLKITSDLESLAGGYNDEISSLVVNPNWCMTLFEHGGYSGSSWDYCAGDAVNEVSWIGHDKNDRVSSIRIREAGAGTIYQNASYGGWSLKITGDLESLAVAYNNQISSLVVNPNWCMTLFELEGYSGSSWEYCAWNVANKVDWVGGDQDDRVSSIRVRANWS